MYSKYICFYSHSGWPFNSVDDYKTVRGDDARGSLIFFAMTEDILQCEQAQGRALSLHCFPYIFVADTGADQEIFKGLRKKILKEKCLLIHVSTHVRIETRQTCNYFSLLLFQ